MQESVPRATIFFWAYQSFGVVYGELSTSPLYVYRSTFSGRPSLRESDDEILGILSFILYTMTIIPIIKYMCIVLSASDNGEGAQFLYIFHHLIAPQLHVIVFWMMIGCSFLLLHECTALIPDHDKIFSKQSGHNRVSKT